LKKNNSILNIAQNTILEESKAIAHLVNSLNDDFEKSVNQILNSKGRVIVTGVGKSANIATKIVATLNSTGTPSIFMHAADAIHGDLGNVQKEDIVICLSKSGSTTEVKVLVPFIKKYGNKLIAITGNPNSFLGTNADFVLNTYVEKEACPNNLAPTTSTTAQLVMGDALAVCLLKVRGFSNNDFAKYHPGGALGKRLTLKVSDLIEQNSLPEVTENETVANAIIEISKKRLGVTAVVKNNSIIGIITDGDIRRMLEKTTEISTLTAKDIMGKNPKTISKDAMAIEALETMENNSITQILVVNKNKYVGVVHLHDLIKEGIF
jgi:arabinose-5-phosphate isomerase